MRTLRLSLVSLHFNDFQLLYCLSPPVVLLPLSILATECTSCWTLPLERTARNATIRNAQVWKCMCGKAGVDALVWMAATLLLSRAQVTAQSGSPFPRKCGRQKTSSH